MGGLGKGKELVLRQTCKAIIHAGERSLPSHQPEQEDG